MIAVDKYQHKILKRLSTDKPYELLFPERGYQSYFVIYANGNTWIVYSWGVFRLYWVQNIDDLKDEINLKSIEYEATWLTDSQHVKNIERIIWRHPNLTTYPKLLLPIWMLKFLFKRNLKK